MKWRRLLSSLVFAVLLIGAVVKCADLLEYKEAREKYTPFYESETNFDVIFLGTSHMWNHVLPMEMWKDYGIASYNWGYSNCTPAENYYLIQDILKYTSPKVVVLDTFGLVEYDCWNNGKYRSDCIEQQHVQFDSLPVWSLNKFKAARDVFDDYEDNRDFVWNFLMYHNRWTELGERDFDYQYTTEKGSCFLTGLGEGWFNDIGEEEKCEIDSVCYPYYLKIIEYCQEQGIPVLCTYLPYGSPGEENQRIANTIGDIVEQYPNCSYVNMLTKEIPDYNTDVYPDSIHLNYSGALKTTAWLGAWLKDHYELEDYSDNASWIEAYHDYVAYKQETLQSLTVLADYLVQLKDDDFTAEVEVYDRRLADSELFGELLQNAEIMPRVTEKETDACARIIVRNSRTGEQVEDACFAFEDPETVSVYARKIGAEE